MFTFPTTMMSSSDSFVDPTSISDLLLWVDATDASTITTVGGSGADQYEVTEWADKSGNNCDFAPEAGVSRPEYNPGTTAWQINSKDCLHFDATDWLHSGNLGRTEIGFTMFWVQEQDTSSLLWHAPWTTSFNALSTWVYNSGNLRYRQAEAQFKSGVEDNDPHMYSVSKDIPASGNTATAYAYRDSATAFGSGSDTLGASHGTHTNIGALSATYASNGFVGTLGEVVYYDRPLNATERTQVTNYLMTKWGIS